MPNEDAVLGTTDYDFFLPQFVDNFIEYDKRVEGSRALQIIWIEIWLNKQRLLDWFVTTKLLVIGWQN